MRTIHVRHTGKVVLALEEMSFGNTDFDLHLVYDLDLHSVGNITMT